MKKSNIFFKTRIALGMVIISAGICVSGLSIHATQVFGYDYEVTDSQYLVNPKDSKSDAKGIQDILDKAKGADQMVTIYFPAGDYYVD